MQVIEIFKECENLLDKEVKVKGWVKTFRPQKQTVFIHLSDGTTQQTLQIIASTDLISELITTGTSLYAKGTLVKSPAKGQLIELIAHEIKIYQICPTTFPFQKVGLPLDFIRTLPHLRHRTNIMRAVFKTKSVIMTAIHRCLTERHYCYIDIPVITTNACEGGCQPLQVTSLLMDSKREDFFGRPVYLTVSNQLHLECFAHGMGYVYTITPATRGEPSQSTKHLAHFNMLEYEGLFETLEENIDLSETLIKYCVSTVLTECQSELTLLDQAVDGKLLAKLTKIASQPFVRIEHRDAIKLLKKAHQSTPFDSEPQFGDDLSGEHERWLVKYFDHPVVVMRYPKAVKAFYMPVHHMVEEIEYVDCFDLLMDIGETVGGSQRITDEKELVSRMTQFGIDPKQLDWYVDLRRYGTIPHGGCGLGIERLTAVITGMTNVKDCISFPLTVHHCVY